MLLNMVKVFAQIGYRQLKNLARFITGKPLSLPSFGSMTLDTDDVYIARTWLKRRCDWYRFDEIEHYHAAFADWNGSAHAFSFMGGRIALSAAIRALDLKPGDEVILPGYTCVVAPNAFHFAGITTVFSDIELDTYGLEASQIEAKITHKTRAILLHHLYGLVCRDYEEIMNIARRHSLYVIEDCAQSTGAEYKGKKVGNWGDIAIYSSEQSKVFNTIQGGIAVTNNNHLAGRLQAYYEQAPFPDNDWIDRLLHNIILNYYRFKHPHRWWLGDMVHLRYRNKNLISTTLEEERGICPRHYGRKLPSGLAAIGLNQLKKIDKYNERRRQTAKKWDHWCEVSGYKKPLVITNSTPVYLRYPVLVEHVKKQERSWAAKELGIELGVWFVGNMHPTSRIVEGCSNADIAVMQCVNFPTLLE